MLITLALIIAISSLIAIGLLHSDNAVKEANKKHSIIQTSVFIQQIADILSKKSAEINSTEGLEMLILMPIELQSDELSMEISFDSAAKGLNPNNLLKKDRNKTRINADYVLLFDRILQSVNLQSKELFLALLEDTLDKDLEERIPGSEIALYNKRFAQGQIENFQKFCMLLDRYVELTEDPAIYEIPWREILGFYSKQIDFNYISPTLLRYILPYLDPETIKALTTGKKMGFAKWKDLQIAKEYRDELKKFNIAFYVPIVRANMVFQRNGRKSLGEFVYDIKQKKVVDIGYKIN